MSASTFAPHGLQPVNLQTGSVWTGGQLTTYRAANSIGTGLFMFDMVKLSSGLIAAAAAGDTPVGIFMGCQYIDSTGKVQKSPYLPASTAFLGSSTSNVECYVLDDPNIAFMAQFSNAGASETGTHAQTDVGKYYNHFAGAGTTATGLSNFSVDYATANSSSSSRTIRMVKWLDRADNDIAASNARGIFVFAIHAFKALA